MSNVWRHTGRSGPPQGSELAWTAAHGTLRRLQPGDVISRMGEVVSGLFIVLSGRASIRVDRGAGRRKVTEWCGGDVTGVLPFSRTWMPPGDTIVDEEESDGNSALLQLARRLQSLAPGSRFEYAVVAPVLLAQATLDGTQHFRVVIDAEDYRCRHRHSPPPRYHTFVRPDPHVPREIKHYRLARMVVVREEA